MRTDSKPTEDPVYIERVNRAIDYIVQHLEETLSLETVAQAAWFSPFHFHRIFRALVGETLNQFVKRLRLERALAMLYREPQRSLTEIGLACGFQSSSDFSRSFKQRFGVPPSVFDVETFRDDRRQDWLEAIADDAHRHRLQRLPPGENPDGFEVQIRRLPARTVAYIRVADPFHPTNVPAAAERLVAWAEEHSLADGQWLGYMWDDPEIVAHQDCRYDVGLEVPDCQANGEVGRLEFPAMQVAELSIEGPIDLEQRAIDWLFGTWLPNSRYLPTEHPSFEAWIGRPFAHGFEHFKLRVQIPITPA